jgi:hypothetical protein
MGMGGRHHCLSVPNQQPGRVVEETSGGAQETAEASSTATEPDTTDTTTSPIPDSGQVEAGEVEGEPSSSGGQEVMLPPGLTIVLSLPMLHTPVSLSPEAISVHSTSQSSHSSHPSAGLTPPPPAHEALAMVHLERCYNLLSFSAFLMTQQILVTVYYYFLTRLCDSLVQICTEAPIASIFSCLLMITQHAY